MVNGVYRDIALYSIKKAAELSAERAGRKVFTDEDFDVAWRTWRLFLEWLPERPLWLRHTWGNP